MDFKVCRIPLTQLSDVVLGDVAREADGTSEQRRVGSPVVQPEALVLTHLGGRLPRHLKEAAVHHLGVEGRRSWHCNTTQTVSRWDTGCRVVQQQDSSSKLTGTLLFCINVILFQKDDLINVF